MTLPLPDSFYAIDGGAFEATALTRGPWSARHQHGGPPAALLVRAVERAAGDELAIARVLVEFTRPIPVGRVEVGAPVLTRPGRTVQSWSVVLQAGADEVCRATIECIRRVPVALPPRAEPPTLPAPDACAPFTFPFFEDVVAFHRGVEVRVAAGRFGEGDMAAWLRMVRPLIAGEEPSGMQRLLLAADAGNGVGLALPVERYTFINPDLTVVVQRALEGEWVGLQTRTTVDEGGMGVADTALHDVRGAIGRGLQTLVVTARGMPAPPRAS